MALNEVTIKNDAAGILQEYFQSDFINPQEIKCYTGLSGQSVVCMSKLRKENQLIGVGVLKWHEAENELKQEAINCDALKRDIRILEGIEGVPHQCLKPYVFHLDVENQYPKLKPALLKKVLIYTGVQTSSNPDYDPFPFQGFAGRHLPKHPERVWEILQVTLEALTHLYKFPEAGHQVDKITLFHRIGDVIQEFHNKGVQIKSGVAYKTYHDIIARIIVGTDKFKDFITEYFEPINPDILKKILLLAENKEPKHFKEYPLYQKLLQRFTEKSDSIFQSVHDNVEDEVQARLLASFFSEKTLESFPRNTKLRLSWIHGDLNLTNILVVGRNPSENPAGCSPYVIDFALAQRGATIFDFVVLETQMMIYLSKSVEQCKEVYQMLHSFKGDDLHRYIERNVSEIMHETNTYFPNDAVASGLLCILLKLRANALDFGFIPTPGVEHRENDLKVYYCALFLYSLAVIRYPNLNRDREQRQRALTIAQVALEHCDKNNKVIRHLPLKKKEIEEVQKKNCELEGKIGKLKWWQHFAYFCLAVIIVGGYFYLNSPNNNNGGPITPTPIVTVMPATATTSAPSVTPTIKTPTPTVTVTSPIPLSHPKIDRNSIKVVDGLVSGKIVGGEFQDSAYYIFVCIYVPSSGWWLKPDDKNPQTQIDRRTWGTVIGNLGENQIAIYLLPSTYRSPKVLGDQNLPQELEKTAIHSIKMMKTDSTWRVTDEKAIE